MCGIAGFFLSPDSPPLSQEVMEPAVQCLQHRGPDANGIWISPDRHTALAHTRLAIIDLSSAGNQPLADGDGRYRITFNGEIYNFLELRRELVTQGVSFKSRSDTEVLLALYNKYGPSMLPKLIGVFAFAIFDTLTGLTFCARDRLGKKPFVYAETKCGVGIASEIPALRSFPAIDWELDGEAVGLYLLRNLRHVPDPWTIHKGIRRLPAGHAMEIREGKISRTWRWWRPAFEKRNVSVDELRAAIEAAVSVRLRADVPIACLLSGGVDSTGIVGEMRKAGVEDIATFAIGRDETDEELRRAQFASEIFSTEHHTYHVDPERHLSHFDALLRFHGEPIMLLPLLHAYELSLHMRKRGYRVAMAGHGADELFYGYDGHNSQAILSTLLRFAPENVMRALSRAAQNIPVGHAFQEAFRIAANSPGQRKAALYRNEAAHLLPALLSSNSAASIQTSIGKWLGLWFEDGSPKDFIDEAAIIGLMHENAHSVTIAADLPGMAAGVEYRCPFLDHRIVELAWKMHYSKKIPRHFNKATNKQILKQALSHIVPPSILQARKRGFGYFIQEDHILRGAWKPVVDHAFASMEMLGDVLNLEEVRKLKSSFDTTGKVSTQLIAKLFALQHWRENFSPC
jgi:asparagine synthase (glutamine-hydrolysing)